VIPSAAVTLTNQGTGEVRNATADAVGLYNFVDVLPGTYTVSVVKNGFNTFTQKNITLEVNHQVRIDVAMTPGVVQTEVVINAATPELQTETAEVNHQITNTQIEQLPLTSSQGRTFQALYTLIPGAANVKEQNSTASNPARAMSLNVNGISFNNNTTRIDGAINYYGWLPYLIAYVPPAESVANVNIVTNSFNAEQGLAGGASINVTTKSGTKDFHGTAWWFYQDAAFNARPYTATQASLVSATNPTGSIPKNVFNQFGFNLGGPVYIPRVLTGKDKLFFFDNFERTTRRQLITGTLTVPDANMIAGNFSEVAGLFPIYDPNTGGIGGRSVFPGNIIPPGRINPAAATMIANLAPISDTIVPTAAQLAGQMANDFNGSGDLSYNRTTNDAKITYIPSDKTQIFGKYSIAPFNIDDPQTLGAAGGGTFDGGQPGAASGRIQNVGLGLSHVFNPKLVIDSDFGYTRQGTGAQSTLDLSLGDYGLDVLKIPGTNSGPGPDYFGQPYFGIGQISNTGGTTGFSSIGNANGASPFKFRDNQFTGDVNLSYLKSSHALKFGFTYYHFDLNHFQPTSGSFINNPRGGFAFQGGMTANSTGSISAYNALADFLLGLPNQSPGSNSGPAVATAAQINDPNSLRWTTLAFYAQDTWTATSKLTINYGVRFEAYPVPYRDHTGIYVLDPGLPTSGMLSPNAMGQPVAPPLNVPQSGNVVVGGVNGQPRNAGLSVAYGYWVPRAGVAYQIDPRTVIRAGYGMTTDPDSFRFLRDSFPMDLNPNFGSLAAGTIAVNTANNNSPLTLTTGIPPLVVPNFTTGFTSLPITSSTVTPVMNFRRGYIQSWNLFVERQIGASFLGDVGYVGTHNIRQFTQTGYLNAGALPSASTPCMSNGHFNPSLVGGNNAPCTPNISNQLIQQQWCATAATACYNSGGIGTVWPLFGAMYNALQSQLTYHGGSTKQLGVVYTYSHAINFEDNGAGSGSGGLQFNYPAYYAFNRGNASYDQTHNVQVWGVYMLPFGRGQKWATSGVAAAIVGGWQLNGQFSHFSGTPFTVNAASNTANAPGNPLYGQLIAPYQQLGGHARTATSNVSGGNRWFNTASFANPVQPSLCAAGDAGCTTPNGTATTPAAAFVFGNTNRNEFRGPGVSVFNTSVFRDFHIYREAQLQVRLETFNTFNHALLYNNPGTTVGSSTFGIITSFGPASSPTQGARSLQFSGRFSF
jgi:Carboxypeptidase regulatory-like domain/TonB dependent receptor